MTLTNKIGIEIGIGDIIIERHGYIKIHYLVIGINNWIGVKIGFSPRNGTSYTTSRVSRIGGGFNLVTEEMMYNDLTSDLIKQNNPNYEHYMSCVNGDVKLPL